MSAAKKSTFKRADGRKPDELRPISFVPHIAPASAGSVLVSMGNTQVICGVSVENFIPRWMKDQGVTGGWITAEYSMLPYSTKERCRREAAAGKVGGRTQEIQRLIGRSLRAITNLEALGERSFWIDCDVLQADGGTRTAAITGSYVALRMAINRLLQDGKLQADPIREAVAAISVGVVQETPLLDLCYVEDVDAEVDMNIVMTSSGKFVEIQGTAESTPFSKRTMSELTRLAEDGIKSLLLEQQQALKKVK